MSRNKRRVRQERVPVRTPPTSKRRWWIAATLVCVVVVGVALFFLQPKQRASRAWQRLTAPGFTDLTDNAKFDKIVSAETCAECHKPEYDLWKQSQHAIANRLVDAAGDAVAFEDQTTTAGWTAFAFDVDGKRVSVTASEAGTTKTLPIEGVIAVEPLWQPLVRTERGMYQVTPVAFDPAKNEWFHVFGDDFRNPGEWGHWLQRGMNWNSNCAYCHMTQFEKNREPATDSYHSEWFSHGISCVQCHAGAREHVESARRHGTVRPKALTTTQTVESCATCHARREELTKNRFKPSERFHDHYRLTLPDTPGVYYADGQVREEDFEYGSFMMSRMGQAGVTCNDCHDPHSAKLKLPAENNMLCMQCHGIGKLGAPFIVPEEHSHHAADSMGNRCVECHMAKTTYMARDPRRDHGFVSPDPLLTKETGIPNSCNRCHADQTVDWALEWTEKWYGKDYNKIARQRARALQAAEHGTTNALELLLEAEASEQNEMWQAVFTSLLRPYVHESSATQHLRAALKSKSATNRSAAARALQEHPQAADLLGEHLRDEARIVRLDAALTAPPAADAQSSAGRDLQEYLEMNSDRPGGLLRWAEVELARSNPQKAQELAESAIHLDQHNAELKRDVAVIAARAGDLAKARQILEQGLKDAPESAEVHFSLGLVVAEQENLRDAMKHFGNAVKHDPMHARGWYNLALAHTKFEEWPQAMKALERAEALAGATQEIQYVKQIIQTNLDRRRP